MLMKHNSKGSCIETKLRIETAFDGRKHVDELERLVFIEVARTAEGLIRTLADCLVYSSYRASEELSTTLN